MGGKGEVRNHLAHFPRGDLDEGLLGALQAMLHAHHYWVRAFRQAVAEHPVTDMQITIRADGGPWTVDRRRYNERTNRDEVAALLPGTNEEPVGGGIVRVRLRTGGIGFISELNPAVRSWVMPLLHPRGEQGWAPRLHAKAASPRPDAAAAAARHAPPAVVGPVPRPADEEQQAAQEFVARAADAPPPDQDDWRSVTQLQYFAYYSFFRRLSSMHIHSASALFQARGHTAITAFV